MRSKKITWELDTKVRLGLVNGEFIFTIAPHAMMDGKFVVRCVDPRTRPEICESLADAYKKAEEMLEKF